MRTDFDVAVLGAGIAGVSAALAAASGGARVCVIAPAPGASALFSGAWYGAPPDEFQTHLAHAGYPLEKCTQPLPHPNGSLVRCHSATTSHHSAQLRDHALVCGIAGLPGFEAPVLARAWSSSGQEFGSAVLHLPATPRSGWSAASLAAWFHRNVSEFTIALNDVVRREKPDQVILPAVIGLDHADLIHAALQAASGIRIGEALGILPSIPGWRLHNALRRALHNAGVHMFKARARLGDQLADRVQSVTLDGASVQAQKYVLATGKFIAGGITADSAFQEPALDCPVWIEHLDNVFTTSEPLMLTDPERNEPQLLLRAGVHCDAQQRPINHDGDVVYRNVFVAGSVRADWESASRGAGDCARDGWRAGQLAVQS